MSGQLLRRADADTRHECELPEQAQPGDVWQCECRRRFTCVGRDTMRPGVLLMQADWRRRWWPGPRRPRDPATVLARCATDRQTVAGRHKCAPPQGRYNGEPWQCACGYSWTWVADQAVWAGECWLSVQYPDPLDRTGTLVIDRADPVVWMAKELLDEVRCGYRADVELAEDLLTIQASNCTVIYRIGEYDPQRRAYLLTWSD